MTTGLRAKQILKQCGIDARLAYKMVPWGDKMLQGANWEFNNIEYFSICSIYNGVWTFKTFNKYKFLWDVKVLESKNEVIIYLLKEYKLPLSKLCGIYGYFDNLGICVYIGKDTHIYSMTRHYQHTKNPTDSKIDNALIGNNYQYRELFRFTSVDQMNKIEKELIKILKPKYNVHFKEINNE